MNAAPDSLSRRLGPVFAEMAAQAANAQQGPKSGQQGWKIPIPCQPLLRHTNPPTEATQHDPRWSLHHRHPGGLLAQSCQRRSRP